ncbi:hypothetical protein [Paraburkholderia sp. J11-2]|uniref:hypothetical protein n=1 Tax=Paraburkholderia sp. J11-2 TaxID=2805431 RepID=UPI002AB76B9B|nr:hypothetical protein [Paraburkholderia sp. J11-2]
MDHRHRPPLTAAELAAIYDAHPTPVVLRLLREIDRLHGTIRTANAVRVALDARRAGAVNTPGTIWTLFCADLDAEPCLTDPPTPRQRGLAYPGETPGRARRRRREGG